MSGKEHGRMELEKFLTQEEKAICRTAGINAETFLLVRKCMLDKQKNNPEEFLNDAERQALKVSGHSASEFLRMRRDQENEQLHKGVK